MDLYEMVVVAFASTLGLLVAFTALAPLLLLAPLPFGAAQGLMVSLTGGLSAAAAQSLKERLRLPD